MVINNQEGGIIIDSLKMVPSLVLGFVIAILLMSYSSEADKPTRETKKQEKELVTSVRAKGKTDPWEDICLSQKNSYCVDVGKTAYDRIISGIKMGTITGVTHKPKGANTSLSSYRISSRDAFYYIIDDGGRLKPFIRQCREIKVR